MFFFFIFIFKEGFTLKSGSWVNYAPWNFCGHFDRIGFFLFLFHSSMDLILSWWIWIGVKPYGWVKLTAKYSRSQFSTIMQYVGFIHVPYPFTPSPIWVMYPDSLNFILSKIYFLWIKLANTISSLLTSKKINWVKSINLLVDQKITYISISSV